MEEEEEEEDVVVVVVVENASLFGNVLVVSSSSATAVSSSLFVVECTASFGQKDSGMRSVINPLRCILNTPRRDKVPNSGGNEPDKALSESARTSRDDRDVSSVGMVPEN